MNSVFAFSQQLVIDIIVIVLKRVSSVNSGIISFPAVRAVWKLLYVLSVIS